MDEHFFIYNGEFFRVGVPVISAGNSGLRYGDGLFETMRIYNGKILNADLHFERLFNGMKILKMNIPGKFTRGFFLEEVNKLLLKNFLEKNARIRLMVFRGMGNIFDPEKSSSDYIIETSALSGQIKFNEDGLVIDIFPDARKSCDQFSNLKSNNYLSSVMAQIFAKANDLDDGLLLNSFDRICESSIANIFLIKNDNIFTPPLSEGCVAGVMRRILLEKKFFNHYMVSEKSLTERDLLEADELFLTNSVQRIRWVKKFREKLYLNNITTEIFEEITQEYFG